MWNDGPAGPPGAAGRELEWTMRLFPILSAFLVGLFLYAFVMERDTLRALAGAEAEPASTPEAAVVAPTTAVAVVAEHSIALEVESGVVLRGRTEAARRVEVRAETTGLVVSDPLRRGARVEAGDLLCAIDPGPRPAQLAEAEARLAEAEANNTASERLAERGYTAETTAIANRASLQAAQAMIDQARREIERLQIHAPFGGLLESDTAELGTLLQPGSECATVIALDPIKLIGFVPETAVDKVKVDAPVGARLLTGQEVAGRVTFVSRSADPDTRTFLVEAEVPNADLSIRDGITAEIRVALEGTPAHLVPQSALTLDDAGRLGLRAVVDDTARFMPVEVVRDAVDGVWVTGLPESLDVIVVGQDFVTDGQPVAASFREQRP
jgi:multidrug efflux system membrane fusion protein